MRDPNAFTKLIQECHYGATALRLAEELAECVDAARQSGKPAKMQVTITIKPIGQSGQYQVKEESKLTKPTMERGVTIMFGTPEGNLQVRDPGQGELDFGTLPDKPKPTEIPEKPSVRLVGVDDEGE